MVIRYMAGIDIPNAFEQSDLKSDGKAITIIMVLRDKFALRMIKTAPEVYVKHVTKDKYVNMIFLCETTQTTVWYHESISIVLYQNYLQSKGFL